MFGKRRMSKKAMAMDNEFDFDFDFEKEMMMLISLVMVNQWILKRINPIVLQH